jgi:hypothetical protein
LGVLRLDILQNIKSHPISHKYKIFYSIKKLGMGYLSTYSNSLSKRLWGME